jgi:hypothetical protein
MAGTPFSTIFDQFMQFVTDYRLISLFNTSVPDFEQYLTGFLVPAITDFTNCNQSLLYSSSTFDETLTQENIKILALLTKRYWLKKTINDITQMNLHVTDKDFKTYAESTNLTAKLSLYEEELEETSQMIVSYGLNNNEMWTNWINGTFWVAP